MNGVEDEDKMEMLLIALECDALTRYQWWEDQVPLPIWRQFKDGPVKHCMQEIARNPTGPLLKVKQTRSGMQYRGEFELVVSRRRDLNRETIMSIFASVMQYRQTDFEPI